MPDVPGLYQRFGVRLRRGNAAGWARCNCFRPGHKDRHASCNVHLQAGTFRCFGCGAKGGVLDALQLLGVTDRDEARVLADDYGIAFDRRAAPYSGPSKQGAKPEVGGQRIDWAQLPAADNVLRRRHWVYVDEHGTPVGRVVRLDLADGGKRIWQERPVGERWAAGMDGRTLPLYRLPEVRKRARAGKRVLVVEGEKVVEALDRIGAFATTNPGGAGKWQPEYTGSLRGARVTVIADCDLEGRRHAVQVSYLLLSGGIDVTMPLDPAPYQHDGFDIADHLAGVATTIRATSNASRWRIRWMLADHLRGMLNHCLPAEMASLQAKSERLTHDADPSGRPLLDCPTCGRQRPHRVAGGLAYCPCGGFHPVEQGAA